MGSAPTPTPFSRRDNPDICTVSWSVYGTDGPLAGSGGVDMVVQAMSGMTLAQGEPERPVCTTVAVVDVTAAAVCALGVIAAVLHRERTGGGQPASASLVATSTLTGSGALVRCPGRCPAMQGRVDFRGPAPLDRYYQVADGWSRVQSRTPRARRRPGAGRPVRGVPGQPVKRRHRIEPGHRGRARRRGAGRAERGRGGRTV
jgi:crotonobetainyl-CoA:carnitine CoA-transferase CaiB-like acyl-CoA transferase